MRTGGGLTLGGYIEETTHQKKPDLQSGATKKELAGPGISQLTFEGRGRKGAEREKEVLQAKQHETWRDVESPSKER